MHKKLNISPYIRRNVSYYFRPSFRKIRFILSSPTLAVLFFLSFYNLNAQHLVKATVIYNDTLVTSNDSALCYHFFRIPPTDDIKYITLLKGSPANYLIYRATTEDTLLSLESLKRKNAYYKRILNHLPMDAAFLKIPSAAEEKGRCFCSHCQQRILKDDTILLNPFYNYYLILAAKKLQLAVDFTKPLKSLRVRKKSRLANLIGDTLTIIDNPLSRKKIHIEKDPKLLSPNNSIKLYETNDSIYYRTYTWENKWKLDSVSGTNILYNELLDYLKENIEIQVELVGCVDKEEKDSWKDAEIPSSGIIARESAIRLIANGIDSKRIKVIASGSLHLAYKIPVNTGEHTANNRVLVVLKSN